MHLPKPQKIQSKFVAGLVGAFLLIGVVCTLGFHAHVRSVLEEDIPALHHELHRIIRLEGG